MSVAEPIYGADISVENGDFYSPMGRGLREAGARLLPRVRSGAVAHVRLPAANKLIPAVSNRSPRSAKRGRSHNAPALSLALIYSPSERHDSRKFAKGFHCGFIAACYVNLRKGQLGERSGGCRRGRGCHRILSFMA